MPNKVLILGDGLLATELAKQSGYDILSRKKDGFDLTDTDTFYNMTKISQDAVQSMPYDVIINCIANTDTYSDNKELHWDVNYKGVSDLVDFCNKWKVKLVHIVTDYIYTNSIENASEEDVPVHCSNWYGYTKLLGDAHVQLKCNNYLLIRCTHKAKPFLYDSAWKDQIGNFDYVDVIGNKILNLINKDQLGIFNVGTEIKSMYELATITKQDVQASKIPPNTSIPKNVTMDINKMKKY
jgi:dTDP-4-dehydrorhamnose reductase